MGYQRTRRYPEISPDITMAELSRKWSELVRELNTRDTTPVPAADIYGRNYDIEPVFVTAGTSLPIAPTPAYWNVYQYNIPADAGLVLVEPVSVSTAANVQVQTFLPPAQFSEGRTVTIAFDTDSDVSGYSAFNLAIFARTEVSNSLVLKETNIGGSFNIDVTSTPRFTDVSGNAVVSTYALMTLSGSTLFHTYAVSVAGPTLQSSYLTTRISNTTTTSASLVLNYAPLTKTFRAFRNKWIQIA